MSKRRSPGERVRLTYGAGFTGGSPSITVKVPEGKAYEMDCVLDEYGKWKVNTGGEASFCMMECGDSACREWANLEIVEGEGCFLYHVSECQMVDELPHRSH